MAHDIHSLDPKQAKKLEATFAQMRAKAAEDPIYFINTFLRIYNPKQTPTDIPFKLFPFQKRLIRDLLKAVADGEDIFVDKAREMGVTYTILATFIWMWLFRPGTTLLVGSRKEEFVDNRRGGLTGNKESSLFGKVDYMLSRLPGFMLPQGFNQDKHFNFMSLINIENGNSMSGESSNPNFSRGARATAIFLDEFAFWQEGSQVWGATADTTNCRIVATTPGEKPSKAKRLRFGKDGEKIKVVELNYHLDPRKDAKWLEEQRGRRSEDDFNREIMMNWDLALRGRIYPEMDKANYGDFPFIPGAQLYCAGDYGLDGTSFIFLQQNPQNGKYRLIDSFHYDEEAIEYCFPLFGKPFDSAFTYLDTHKRQVERIAKLPPAVHFGDPSVKNRKGNKEKQSDFDKLMNIGVVVNTYTDKNSIDYRVSTTKVFLSKGFEINKTDSNEYAFEAFKSYRWKVWEEDHETTANFRKPVHNWCSHPSTSLEYAAVNLEYYQTEIAEEPDWVGKSRRNLTSRSNIPQRR